MVSQVETDRFYLYKENANALNEALRAAAGEHVIVAGNHFLAFAELDSSQGIVAIPTEQERIQQSAFFEGKLGVSHGIYHHLASKGWAGVYAEHESKQFNGTQSTIFGGERVILNAQTVEELDREDKFIAVGDIACATFAPKFAQLDTTRLNGDTNPDYKRHLDVQYNRGLLLMAEMRRAGMDITSIISTQDAKVQDTTLDRINRLKTLLVRGGITPVVAKVLGWDNPAWLDPTHIAARAGAFELDVQTTSREVLETLLIQLDEDEKMKASAEAQVATANTTGGSSERFVTNIVKNVVTNLFGIK